MLKKMLLMLSVILVMITSIAFSALSTSLAITSEVKFRPLADIRVNSIAMDNASGALIAYDSDYSKNSVSNGFILPTAGSSISYRVHIDNSGDIDYSIYDIIRSASANGVNVAVSGYNITDVIRAKTSVDLLLTYTTNSPSENVINVVDTFDFKKVYHVTYETGTNQVIPAQVKYEGVDLNLTNTVPTKDGYSFVKWNSKSDGTGINYNSGATYTQDEDLTLYARYSLNTYNINYVLSGGTNAISNPTTYTIESNDIVLANATKEGYEFKGWTGNGTTTATKNLILPAGSFGDKTFTAHFEDETYPEITVTSTDGTKNYLTTAANINAGWNSVNGTLTYKINATDVGSGISKIEYAITNSTTPPTTGWTETTNGDHSDVKARGVYYIHVRATDLEDNVTTVTTKAQAVRFRVGYFDDYSKSTNITASQYYTGTALTTRTPDAVTGYTFDGWYNSSALTTKVVDANTTYTPPTSIRLFGKWNPNVYNITYSMNNGVNNANNPSTYTIESDNITLINPTKTLTFKGNYNSTSGANASNGSGVVIGANQSASQEFLGWTGSNGDTPQKNPNVTIPTGSTGDKSYTAHWTAVAGTVPAVTRTGYTCGWSTTSTGTTIEIVSGGSYGTERITEGMAATVNLYAVCTPNSYSISYTMNGGNNPSPKPTTGVYDADVVIGNPTKTFTVNINANGQSATIKNAGGTVVSSASSTQTFAGWTSTTVGSNALTGENASSYAPWNGTTSTATTYFKNLRETGTVTMFANWTAVNVTLPNITKTGYTCGYATSANGSIVYNSGASYTPSTTTNTATVYAKCNPNTYNISYTLNNGTSGTNAPTSAIYDTDVVISNPTKTVTVTGDANGTGATVGASTSSNQIFLGWSSSTIGNNALTGTNSSNYSAWNGTTKTTNTYFKNLKESGTVTMVANWTPVSITLPTLSKQGYVCKWYTEATGGAELGSTYTPTANSVTAITVYARCNEANDTPYRVNHYVHDLGTNTYTLNSYDDLVGTTNATLTLANLKKTIPGFTYTSGYLTGNTTKPTSGAVTTTTILADGSRVINLYYRRNYLYVRYHVNGGTLNTTNTAYGVSNNLITNTSNSTATNFLRGVYGSKVGSVDTSTYVVSSGLHNYNSSNNINIERQGYVAVNNAEWNTEALGTGTSYGQDDTTINANGFAGADLTTGDKVVTIYVHWTASSYTITYAMNNGVNNANNPYGYSVETPTITLENPTKTITFKGNYNSTSGANAASGSGVVIGANKTANQEFLGWTGSNGNTPQMYPNVTIPTGSVGNKNYTAHWTAVTGTVPTVTRTGYICGWSTSSTGTTREIASGATFPIENITEGMAATVNLYAVCTPKTYTLTIHPQGGTYNNTTNDSTKTMTYDSTNNNDIGVPTRSGYTFDGWYLVANNKTSQLFNSTGKNTALAGYFSAAYSTGVWKHDGNVDVYAHWSKNVSSLTKSISPTSYIYDNTDKEPSTTVKDGNNTLTRGTDYTVAYTNNRNVGTATATITGAGVYNSTTKAYYTGSTIIEFPINNAKLTFNVGTCESISGSTVLYTKKGATGVFTTIDGSDSGVIPTASKTGYTFNGWYDSSTGGNKVLNANRSFAGNVSGYTDGSTWQTVQDKQLYARCTANNYTVTANANGGSIAATAGWTGTGNSATKQVVYDEAYGTLPTISKTGYSFVGWSKDAAPTNIFNVNTMTFSNSSVVAGTDIISFNSGVYDRILSMTKWVPETDTDYTLVINVLENTLNNTISFKTDSRFYIQDYNGQANYAIAAGNTGTHIINFKTRSDFSSVTLGSFWLQSPNTIQGTFKARITIVAGKNKFIDENTIVKTTSNHNIYAYWSINKPDTPTITGGETKIYGSHATTLTCSVDTEYATGTDKYYSFGYATSNGGNPSNWTQASDTNTLNISETEYVGQRWYSCRVYASDGTQTTSTIASSTSADAEVTINNAKITYLANDCGTISGTNPAYVKKGTTGFLSSIRGTGTTSAATISKDGYTFNGWYSGNTKIINADGTIVSSVTGWTDGSKKWLITEDKELTAICSRNGYSITYTMNNGINNANNPSSYNVESDPITLIAPTKTLTFKGNYNATNGANASSGSGVVIGSNTTQAQTFAGWSGTGITGNSTSVTISTGSTGNRSYTAHWTAVAGTVPTITKTGYTCGWTTTSTGTTIEIASGGSYATSRITEGMSSVVNLYAVCVPKTYTLTINSQGGTYNSTTNNSTKTMTYDSTDNNDIGVPTRSGYTFDGWYLVANNKTSQLFNSTGKNTALAGYFSAAYSTGVWKHDGNVTVYAHWSKNVSSLTNSVSPTSYIYDGNSKTPTPTVKDGNNVLNSGVDYTVSYSNNTNVGTATATITGANVYNSTTKAYYTGTSTVSYYINNAKLTFNAGNCASVNGTGTLYTRKNATKVYTGERNSTEGVVPTGTPQTGYVFDGWYTASTGGSKVLNANGTFTGVAVSGYTSATSWQTIANKDLYARCNIGSYTLTINPNGGTYNGTTSSTQITQDYGSTYAILNNPTKTGYIFAGWELTSGRGNITWYQDSEILKQYLINSTSVTKPNVYNNKGNGTVTLTNIADNTSSTGYSMRITTNGLASPGAGGFINNNTTTSGAIYYHKIVAKIPVGYSLAVASNSGGVGYGYYWITDNAGTGDWETYIYAQYSGYNGPFSSFGHVYINGSDNTNVTWYINESTIYRKGTTLAETQNSSVIFEFLDSDATVTAKWSTSGSTVTWEKQNGIFGNGTVGNNWTANSTQFRYLSVYTGTKRAPYYISDSDFAFYRDGYTFDGWYTSADGGTKLFNADGSIIPSVDGYTDANSRWIKYDGNVTVYAHWLKPITLLNNTISPTSYIYDGNSKTPTPTVKDGNTELNSGVDYTVSYSNNTNVGTARVEIIGSNVYNSTTKAYYTEDTTLSYYINNAKLTFAAGSCASVNGTAILYTKKDSTKVYTEIRNTTEGTIPTASKSGYIFQGWYSASTGGSKVLNANGTFSGTAVANYTDASSWQTLEDQILYARCSVNDYTITYAMNNGINDSNNPDTYTVDSPTITLSAPTKTLTFKGNYNATNGANASSGSGVVIGSNTTQAQTFAGWSGTGITGNSTSVTISTGSTGNRSYTAHWTAVAGTVPTITKTGYTCGWTTTSTGTTIEIASGGSYATSRITEGMSSVVNLYAVCVHNVYTITLNNQSATTAGTTAIYEKYNTGYYLNNNNGTVSNQMTTSANGITVPTRNGYTFGGYYTEANGSGTQYIDVTGKLTSNASTTQFTSNGTLYAKWTKNAYTVVYNNSCDLTASGSMSSSSHTYDTAKALTTNAYGCSATVTYNYNGATGGNSTTTATANASFLGWTVGGPNLLRNVDLSNSNNLVINENDGTFTISYDNTSGTSTYFGNFFYKTNANLITNTNYVYIADVKSINNTNAGNGYMSIYSSNVNTQLTTTTASKSLSSLSTGLYHANMTSASSFAESTMSLRGFVSIPKEKSASINFRPIVIQGTYNGVDLYYGDGSSVMNLATSGIVNVYTDWNEPSVTLPTPTKTGYTFGGWYSNSSLTTKVGNGGDKYIPSATGTLYAKWTINNPATPTITGGETKVYGSNATTLTCSTSTNYASGATKYYSFGYATSDGGTPSNWTTASTSATLNISATEYIAQRWYSCRVYATDGTLTTSTVVSASNADTEMTINNAKLTFNAGSCNSVSGSTILYTKKDSTKVYTGIRDTTEGTVPTASKSGYIFQGWYNAASGGNKVLNADGTFTGTAVSDYTNATSWQTIANKDLYARCSMDEYSITYSMNNGINNENNPDTYTVDTPTITLQAPTKTLIFKGNPNATASANANSGVVTIGNDTTAAQTFKGWTGSNGNTAQTSVTIPIGSTGNKSYTARWTSVTGALPTVTREGYVCGWNRSSTGTTIQYLSGATYPINLITEGMSATVNLYAVCVVDTFELTLYPEGGTYPSTTPGGKNLVNIPDYVSTSSATIRNVESSKLIDVQYKNATQYTISANITLSDNSKAFGVRVRYTDESYEYLWLSSNGTYNPSVTTASGKTIKYIEFSYNSSTNVTMSNFQLEEGATATSYEPFVVQNTTTSTTRTMVFDQKYNNDIGVPTREGYTFAGWYTAANGGTQVYGSNGRNVNASGYFSAAYATGVWKKAEDTSLYAHWTKSVSTLNNSISPTAFVYNGNAQNTTPSVSDGETLLTQGVDYTTIFSNNTNVGTATARITGANVYNATTKAYYIGETTLSYYINNATLTFNAGSCDIVSGTSPLYTRKGATAVYTGLRETTETGTIPTAIKPGNTFLGWYTASTGGSKVLNANGTFTGVAVSGYTNATSWQTTGNKNLYAQCGAAAYTVTANANGGSISSTTGWTGTGNTASKSVAYGSPYGTLPTVSRVGYEFNGWSLLPEGYTQVEYIESTGTQYIDTGYVPNDAGGKVETKVSFTSFVPVSSYSNIYGVEAAAAPWNLLGVRTTSAKKLVFLTYSDNYTNPTIRTENTAYTIEQSYKRLTSTSQRLKYAIDGLTLIDTDKSSSYVIQQVNMYLFAANINGPTRYSKIKMYYFRLYDEDTLVREMVPCINNSTGKAGMYDLVNGVFYGNSGTGDFTAGDALYITSETIMNSPKNHTIYAKWSPNVYSVTFDATTNDGTLNGTSPLYVMQGTTGVYTSASATTAGTIPTATKTGWTFTGWYDGATKVINNDGTVVASVTGWTDANRNWLITENKTLTAGFEIVDPNAPTITGGNTSVYNYADRQLTCSTSSSYASGTSVYYEFGYATSVENFELGNITWLGNASTNNKYVVVKDAFLATRYYTCRIYTSDGVTTSDTIQATTTTQKSIVNARIYFDATTNGGTISGSQRLYVPYGGTSVYTGRQNTTPGTIPSGTKTGWTFNGWYTAATGGTQVINSSGVVQASVADWTDASKNWLRTNASANDTVNVLYAQYTVNNYTISYTMNNGPNPATKPTTATYGSDVVISNPGNKTITVTGNANGTGATIGSATTGTQTFSGWTSSTLGNNALAGANASSYAAWTGTSTKNTYFKNLKESGTVTMVANWSGTVTLPTLSKPGHTCKWYTTSGTTGGSLMGNSGATWTIPSASATSVTAYARCTVNQYTLTLKPNGGLYNGSSSNVVVTQEYGTTYNVPNTPTKEGYTFTGWKKTAGSGTYEYIEDSSITPTYTSALTYNAANSTRPTVYNNAGGGTVTNAMVADASATGGYSLNVVTNGTASPGAGGIYFNLWPTVANRINVLIVRAKIPAGYSIKLGGVGASYTGFGSNWVTYDGAGTGDWKTYYITEFAGTTGNLGERVYMYIDGSNNTSVSWNVDSITVKSYTKDQYNGVYTFGEGNGQLTAQWGAGGAKVTWDKQGGTFGNGTIGNKWTAAASYFTYTSAYTDTKKAPYYISDSDFAIYKPGYTFVGWYTAATGGTQVFDATGKLNASVSGYSDADRKWQKYDSNTTLYARWATESYTVTYNTTENGGTGTIDSTTVAFGDPVPLPTTGASKAGWTFVGWNTDKNATSALSSLTMGSDDITLYAIYRKEAVTLNANWDANGATLSSTAQSTCTLAAVYNNNTQATNCTVTAPTITRANYDIIGWNQSASATTNDTSYNTSTGKLTLTSSNTNKIWYAITKTQTALTATFAANNGATVSSNSATCYLYGTSTWCEVNAPTVTAQTGFRHIGFNTSADSNSNNTNYTPSTGKLRISANSTWYPITESNTSYTAEFRIQDTNAVNQTTSSVFCYRYNGATSCSVQSPTLTPKTTDYIIVGWGLTSTSTDAAYANGASIPITADITFYSITYLDDEITITFNRNITNSKAVSQTPYGGSTSTAVTVESRCVRMNGNLNCSVISPTMEVLNGYHAVGYNTTPNAQSSVWDVGTAKDVSANATYYAITAGNSYSIKFNANCPAGITPTGSMSNLAMTYGTAKNLTANAFGCAGRVFNGWATNAQGTGTTYSDGESVNNLTPVAGATVNLYAKWRYIDPTPTISGGTSKIYGVGSTTLTCSENTSYPTGTNKYYSFGYTTSANGNPGDWTNANQNNTLVIRPDEYVGTRYYSCRVYVSNGTEESNTITSASPTTNSINNAKITFKPGTCGTENQIRYVNISMTGVYTGIGNTTVGTMPTTTKEGYVFTGWYDGNTKVVNADGSINSSISGWTDASKKWLLTADDELTAGCAASDYTITYALNNGVVSPPNLEFYSIDSSPITLTNPTKSLTFTGNPNATSGANAPNGTLTIGTVSPVSQIFKGWSGTGLTGNNNTTVIIPTGSTGNRSYTAHYTSVTGVTPTVTRTGYTCGWNRSSTGTTKEIDSGATFPIGYISEGMSSTVNLYAVCTPKTYTINYSCGNDGTGTPPVSATATYNSSFTVATTANTCAKPGYEFAGWVDTTNADWTNWSGIWVYDNGDYGIQNNEMTLSAVYAPLNYTITYNLDGGEATNPESYDKETPTFTLENPTRLGYEFAGWTGTGLNELTSTVTITQGSTGDRSYTAHWIANNYYLDLNALINSISVDNISGCGTVDVYVNGTKVANDVDDYHASWPTGSTYEVKDIKATSGTGCTYTGENSYTGTINGFNTSVSVPFTFSSRTFNYTGSMQTFVVPVSGQYRLEVWGAQGGTSSSHTGGLGGYTNVSKCLTGGSSGDTLYVGVGGTTATANGGWNGGGCGNGWNASCDCGAGVSSTDYTQSSTVYAAGGGGATHIGTVNAQLRNYASDQRNPNYIYAVAGGGGGGSEGNNGGAGGKLNGLDGYGNYKGYGGSSTLQAGGAGGYGKTSANGSFGQGGTANRLTSVSSGVSRYWAGGGGGGLYGGGGGDWSTSNSSLSYSGGGGGGSGTQGLSGYPQFGGTGTAGEDGVRTGNGQAIITWEGACSSTATTYHDIVLDYNINQTFTAPAWMNTYYTPNWSKSFDIDVTFTPGTSGRRYFIFGNYDKTATNAINLEVNSSNQFVLWVGPSSAIVNTTFGSVTIGSANTVHAKWDATTGILTITTSDGASGSYTGYIPALTGVGARSLKFGSFDYREGGDNIFQSITVNNFVITEHYASPAGSAITLPDPAGMHLLFDGWTGSNGNTAQYNVTVPAGSNTDKTYTAHWSPGYTFTSYSSGRYATKNNYTFFQFKVDLSYIDKARRKAYTQEALTFIRTQDFATTGYSCTLSVKYNGVTYSRSSFTPSLQGNSSLNFWTRSWSNRSNTYEEVDYNADGTATAVFQFTSMNWHSGDYNPKNGFPQSYTFEFPDIDPIS